MSQPLPHSTVHGAAGLRPLHVGRAWEAHPQPGMWVHALSATDFEDLFPDTLVTLLRWCARRNLLHERQCTKLPLAPTPASRQRLHQQPSTYSVDLWRRIGTPTTGRLREGNVAPALHLPEQGAAGSRPPHIDRAWEAYSQPGMWVHAPSATDFEDLFSGNAGHVTALGRPLPCGCTARSRTSSSTHARHWAVDPCGPPAPLHAIGPATTSAPRRVTASTLQSWPILPRQATLLLTARTARTSHRLPALASMQCLGCWLPPKKASSLAPASDFAGLFHGPFGHIRSGVAPPSDS